jgi:23S rRNA (cytidine1920-2'-O)/16S rRNA (cytidine1409-2'-O)-methyltransferase
MAESRAQARGLIDSGQITVGGAPATKPARLVDPAEALEVIGDPAPFVSRAGGKLAAALDTFGVDPTGRRAVDVGSSTGGFTDCLLQRGATHVVAIDVGTHQLHERLRADPRVTSLEKTDVRSVDPESIGAPFTLVTADLSFISLRLVLDPLLSLADSQADLLLLVKPQFEAGRAEADRGRGVISDPEVWRRVLHEVADAISAREAVIMNLMVSAVPGARGNIEFVAHVRRGASDASIDAAGLDAVIADAAATDGR